ncbi:MAG TPA: GNAT family N-acetyltransferase [Pseudolabrys sp.]|nr:GNAT family N-acetyltransferase [Pseudolabrys sp.]
MTHADVAVRERIFERPDFSAAPRVAAVASSELDLTIHYDLAAAEPAWRELQADGECTVFQTFEWLSAWQRHVGVLNNVLPCIVVVRNERGQPVLILPLAIQKTGVARELTWFGSDLCDYNAPLLAKDAASRLDAETFTSLWSRIVAKLQADPRSQHDLIRLEKMPPLVGAVSNPMLALPANLNPSGSYITPLSGSWDEFYKAKRSSATRRRDRSKRNRLSESGEVKLVSAESGDDALATLATLVEQKSATFAKHGINNLFTRPGYLDFYRDIAGNPAMREVVHISRLEVGAETAATNLGLIFGGRYHHILASYTGGPLGHWGPGAAHLNDLLRYAIERGLTAFDFTIGDERYKRDWCDDVQMLHDHVAVMSWRGALVAGPAMVQARIKRTIKQTPFLWAMAVKARALMAAMRSRKKAPAQSAESPE